MSNLFLLLFFKIIQFTESYVIQSNYFIKQAPVYSCLASKIATTMFPISTIKTEVALGMSCSITTSKYFLSSLHCGGTKSKNLLNKISFMLGYNSVRQAGINSTQVMQVMRAFKSHAIFSLKELRFPLNRI